MQREQGAPQALSHAPQRAHVDANLIIRLLTRDNPDLASQALAVFSAAERGELSLMVSTVTLAEVVWTLSSYYKLPRHDIADKMAVFVNADGLEVETQDEALLALSLFRDASVDFADALLAARALLAGPPVVYSFDRHFDRIPGVQRRAPGQSQ